ncbi:biotin--[acetyl-CoA-carboxylase] ligase [Brachybacterium sp. GPGPB12]|uniref:biotin--[acetyl-CoA-carboxylase] ligase n=1 Tax=Brachybacterium sp. GPGPB12 TaxID=3023517 RepID=UPI0031344C49
MDVRALPDTSAEGTGTVLPRIHRLGAVRSTQDEASALLRAGDAPPFAVTATRQTSGRGRLGRAFASPDGASLALTFAHRTSLDPARRGWFPLAAGLAAVAALGRVVPAAVGERPIGLKWPNDLHTADGRKLGGILVEARGGEDLLLGIGLNLRGPVLDEDGEPVPGAAWSRGEGGLRPDPGPAEDRRLREALEEALVAALDEELAALESAQERRWRGWHPGPLHYDLPHTGADGEGRPPGGGRGGSGRRPCPARHRPGRRRARATRARPRGRGGADRRRRRRRAASAARGALTPRPGRAPTSTTSTRAGAGMEKPGIRKRGTAL